jgi:hypothetical protein
MRVKVAAEGTITFNPLALRDAREASRARGEQPPAAHLISH